MAEKLLAGYLVQWNAPKKYINQYIKYPQHKHDITHYIYIYIYIYI